MADDVEQIEAKLCAYIDGVLPPGEHAEIEAHLAANPSHQALIRDLMRHRNLLRGLPRESAGPELTEELQAQLERDLLLAMPAAEAGSGMRIGRWPQLLSAAAVLLLAIGLGVLLLTVLPTGQPVLTAVDPQPSTAAQDKALDAAGTMEEMENTGPLAVAPTAPTPFLAREQTSIAKASPVEGIRLGDPDAAPPGLADATDINKKQAEPSQTLVITVMADDMGQANEQVVNYLTDNGIAWSEGQALAEQRANDTLALKPANEPDLGAVRAMKVAVEQKAPPADPLAAADGNRTPARGGVDQSPPEVQAARVSISPAPREEVNDSPQKGDGGAVAMRGGTRPAPPLQPMVRRTVGNPAPGSAGDSEPARGGAGSMALNAPATQPAQAEGSAIATGRAAGALHAEAIQQQFASQVRQSRVADNGRVIFARSLNRTQVSELQAALAQSGRNQVASVVDAPAARQPARDTYGAGMGGGGGQAGTYNMVGNSGTVADLQKLLENSGVIAEFYAMGRPTTQPAILVAPQGPADSAPIVLPEQGTYDCMIVLQPGSAANAASARPDAASEPANLQRQAP